MPYKPQTLKPYRSPQPKRDNRPAPKLRGYGPEHRRWRRAVLARDPLCQRCGAKASTHADHIVSMMAGGDPLDVANGQGLCGSCHSAKTARQDGGFGNPRR